MNRAQEKAENLLKLEYRGYIDELGAVGEAVYNDGVLALIRERNYTLFKENGKYRLVRADGTVCTTNNARGDQALWDVLQLMQLNVEGTNNRLGDFMPDYPDYDQPEQEEVPV